MSDVAVPVARLRLCVARLARRVRQHAEPGITPSQLSALTTVARWGPLRLGALAERERISKATLTRLVARLEEAGYLERTPDPDDGRGAVVAVTDAGHRLLEVIAERADAYLDRQVAALSHDERAVLTDAVPVLERLLQVKA